MSINKQILPILNFNFGENEVLRPEEISALYAMAVEVCHELSGAIELSLSSDRAYESFPEFIAKVSELGTELSFGSVNSLEQFSFLKKLLKENNYAPGDCFANARNDDLDARNDKIFDYDIKIFSPAYYPELDEAIKESEGFVYVPGVFDETELDKVESFSELKIFPSAINESYNLRKALVAPYPELSKSMYQQKILEFTKKNFVDYGISEKVFEEDGLLKIKSRNENEEVFLIKKPADYQTIRSRFLFNPSLKIAFINDEVKDTKDLVDSLSAKKLYLTGLGARAGMEAANNHVHATRVFNNVVLDLLSGAIKISEVKALMEQELASRAL